MPHRGAAAATLCRLHHHPHTDDERLNAPLRVSEEGMSAPDYNLDIALHLSSAQIFVFPTDATTKRPLVRWTACSTNLEREVRYYWDVHRGRCRDRLRQIWFVRH
jgi:hypothetical protein